MNIIFLMSINIACESYSIFLIILNIDWLFRIFVKQALKLVIVCFELDSQVALRIFSSCFFKALLFFDGCSLMSDWGSSFSFNRMSSLFVKWTASFFCNYRFTFSLKYCFIKFFFFLINYFIFFEESKYLVVMFNIHNIFKEHILKFISGILDFCSF